MPVLTDIAVYADVTDRSRLQYQFTPKHHGGDRDAAQWLPGLSLDDEFGVFNIAKPQRKRLLKGDHV